MEIYLLGRQIQTMRIKGLQPFCIFHLDMFNQVFVRTIFLTKQKHNFLLDFLKHKILERNDVYFVEESSKVFAKLLGIRHL